MPRVVERRWVADVEYYKACFWEESLTLLGNRQVVAEYKEKIDNLPQDFWDKILGYIHSHENDDPDSFGEYFEENLGVCCSPADYQAWIQCIRTNRMPDFNHIDNIYCLFVIATFYARRLHWTKSAVTNEELLTLLCPIRDCHLKG